MQINKMELKHLDEVASLQKLCFSDPWKKNLLKQEMNNPFAFLVVGVIDKEKKEKVISFLGLRIFFDTADLTTFGVHPSYRKNGYGRELLLFFIHYLKQQDVVKFSLEVRASNTGAIALYKSLGFVEMHQKTNYYSNPQEDGFYMEKNLLD